MKWCRHLLHPQVEPTFLMTLAVRRKPRHRASGARVHGLLAFSGGLSTNAIGVSAGRAQDL